MAFDHELWFSDKSQVMHAANTLNNCGHPHWFAVKLGDVGGDSTALLVNNSGFGCLQAAGVVNSGA